MHTHHHAHGFEHGHEAHSSTPGAGGERRLSIALGLTLCFAAVEAFAGWHAGSLALLGDAGHMLTDSLALGIAAMAAALARRPPTARHSYGFARGKALAAFANALFMLALIGLLLWQSLKRLGEAHPVNADTVTVVALIGLLINLVVAGLLSGGSHDLNTRAALLHVLGDLLGSIAALASGVLIKLTGWTPIDPLLAMLIAGLIAASTMGLLRSAMHTLLNGVPQQLSLPEVGQRLAAVPGVAGIHDLHIWELDERQVALSAHVDVRDPTDWPQLLRALQHCAQEDFGITHVTLQPEPIESVPLRFMARRPPEVHDHGRHYSQSH